MDIPLQTYIHLRRSFHSCTEGQFYLQPNHSVSTEIQPRGIAKLRYQIKFLHLRAHKSFVTFLQLPGRNTPHL